MASVGASVGAVLRYYLGRLISNLVDSIFPWSTWIINMLGTFLLVLFAQTLGSHHLVWWTLLGTGFCGGFTTFSTMSVEARNLMRIRKVTAIWYLQSSVFVGFTIALMTRWM
ncbi:fluoride efflux transporter FluC [Alicyclobacillus sp. ALC3]|uniref:fluoride efflux transporter FluC n=1 Tax=Alicyclobacillus sp. ALC3 TaxID=2796143 RepID=UPI003FCEA870